MCGGMIALMTEILSRCVIILESKPSLSESILDNQIQLLRTIFCSCSEQDYHCHVVFLPKDFFYFVIVGVT